jgi:hypothetical protein
LRAVVLPLPLQAAPALLLVDMAQQVRGALLVGLAGPGWQYNPLTCAHTTSEMVNGSAKDLLPGAVFDQSELGQRFAAFGQWCEQEHTKGRVGFGFKMFPKALFCVRTAV